MNLFALSGLLTGISSLAFGCFVYLQGRAQPLNRLWLIFTASVALWGFGGMWIALAETPIEALWAWRLAYALGVLWIPILYYHFVCVFCGVSRRGLLLLFYLLGLLFLPLIFTDEFFPGVRFVFSSFYYSLPGRLFPIFFLWWIALVIYGHWELLKARNQSSGQKRNQIEYFFLATAIGYSGGSLDFLPIFGIDLYPYGNFAIVLYPIVMTYAIVRYRLMDITIVFHKGLAYGLLLCAVLIPVSLAVVVSHRATFHSVPPLLAATLVFACGLWIVLQNPRAIANITFGLLCLAVCTWMFSFFMIYSTTDAEQALFWGKFIYLGVVFIPATFYHFCDSFLKRKAENKLIFTNYLVSTAFLAFIPTSYVIHGQYSYFWGYYPKAGVLHPLFLTYFLAVSGLALRILYLAYKTKERTGSLEATRLKYIFWAFVIGYFAASDFIPSYGLEFYPIGYLFVTLWVGIVTYAVAKYPLFGISVITKTRVLPYAESLALATLFYLATLMLIRLFTGSMEYLLAGILVATFAIFAGRLENLQKRMERAVGKVIFRERYDAYETLTEFSKALVTILDLRSLTEEIVRTLAKVLGTEMASLYLLDQEKGTYILSASHGPDPNGDKSHGLTLGDGLPHYLARSQSILVREELEHTGDPGIMQPLCRALKAMESEVCIPLINKDRLIGFCNLGPRTSRQMYSEDDLSLLTTLAQNAAIALDNAMLYEDLKRSQILMRRTDRLRSLETIAGGFAHEIRNPLTSIKTFVQLAPERKNDPEFMDHFSKVVFEDVDRIERLIQEILDYARYMEPKFVEEDLNDVVASCMYFIEVKADSKAITVEKDLASDLPRVMLDRQQIKQVLLNLFLNAMEAMSDSGGRLIVKTHRLTKSAGDAWVQIEVADTGLGISAANLEHIFDPFYTTKHESGEREGTGLGLTIVHQIVQEHHGYIEVKSTVGSGTTFFVNLPVNALHRELPKEQEEHEETDPISR